MAEYQTIPSALLRSEALAAIAWIEKLPGQQDGMVKPTQAVAGRAPVLMLAPSSTIRSRPSSRMTCRARYSVDGRMPATYVVTLAVPRHGRHGVVCQVAAPDAGWNSTRTRSPMSHGGTE